MDNSNMINTQLSSKKMLSMKDIRLKPLKIKFNVTTLDMVISFIYKDSVLRTRKTLSNIFKLFTNLDLSYYTDNPELFNRVWIIKKTLEGKVNVIFPEENCRFASYVLRYFHEYLKGISGEDIDVIHWNAGLWDCLRLFEEEQHTPINIYAYYIERICIRIKNYVQMPV